MKLKQIFCLIFSFLILSELADARVGKSMRRSKRFAPIPAAAAVLTWTPSSSADDFLYTSPQTFTLANTGTAAATNLVFSVPIEDMYTYSGGHSFRIHSTTCGSNLNAGASCTIELYFGPCNIACQAIEIHVNNGSVNVSGDGGVSATITPLIYNGDAI